jgi:hypothetical protein
VLSYFFARWVRGTTRPHRWSNHPLRTVPPMFDYRLQLAVSSRNCRNSHNSFKARPLYFFFHTKKEIAHRVCGRSTLPFTDRPDARVASAWEPLLFLTLSTTTEPSQPALLAIQRQGSSSALRMMPMPTFSSSLARRLSSADKARMSATPPPGTTLLRLPHVSRAAHLRPAPLFFHLHFGRGADANHHHPPDELGQALLQLLAVVIRGGPKLAPDAGTGARTGGSEEQ